MEKNILLTISYDGTPFSGWQRQPGRKTVQGEIEDALSFLRGEPVRINGTSRTDAGVHALGQRASFAWNHGIPTERLAYALNNLLPGSIRIRSAEEKPADFHARFDSRGKKYVYRIVNSGERSPFARNFCYYISSRLDIEAMKQAARHMKGTHDFKCFQAAGGQERETTVRTIYGLKVAAGDAIAAGGSQDPASGDADAAGAVQKSARADDECGMLPALDPAGEIRISVWGDGFLYNMVRIMSGTLVDAGLGKIDPDGIEEIIESGQRNRAGQTAPARGLYLAEVFYDEGQLKDAVTG